MRGQLKKEYQHLNDYQTLEEMVTDEELEEMVTDEELGRISLQPKVMPNFAEQLELKLFGGIVS